VPGQGSTFWVTTRFRKPSVSVLPAPGFERDEAEERLRGEYPGATVLLAEDEPTNREIALCLLEEAGLVVEVATDGARAVTLARQNPYDLVLMDMQMPYLNGLDATRAIRADSRNRGTPVLAMTANVFDDDRRACLAAGMNDHVGKPIEPGILYRTVLKWLAANRAARDPGAAPRPS